MGKIFTIEEDRLYRLFKRILDDKFSELSLNKSPWWQTHEDDVEWVDSEGNALIRYNDYSFLILRKYYWDFMHYMPISYKQTNDLFSRYFKERFPDKFFIKIEEFDL